MSRDGPPNTSASPDLSCTERGTQQQRCKTVHQAQNEQRRSNVNDSRDHLAAYRRQTGCSCRAACRRTQTQRCRPLRASQHARRRMSAFERAATGSHAGRTRTRDGDDRQARRFALLGLIHVLSARMHQSRTRVRQPVATLERQPEDLPGGFRGVRRWACRNCRDRCPGRSRAARALCCGQQTQATDQDSMRSGTTSERVACLEAPDIDPDSAAYCDCAAQSDANETDGMSTMSTEHTEHGRI